MEDCAHPFGIKKHLLAVIDPVSCTGCGWCAMFCVVNCIELRGDGFYEVDPVRCIGCRGCLGNCFYGAVKMVKPEADL